MDETTEIPGARDRRRPMADLILGLVGGAMVVLAIAAAVAGWSSPGDGAPPPPPAVTLHSPAEGAVITDRLEVVFTPAIEIGPLPAGWGAGQLHLHLRLDEQELMPARDAIERLPSGAYRWDVGPIPPGPHLISLFWADDTHRALEGGGSAAVRIEGR